MARVLGLKQLLQKRYTFLENLPEDIERSFGKLVDNFVMIVWGMSGNGKSNFLMAFLKAIMPFGKVLYIALEEGFEATTQFNALRNLTESEHTGRIEFADHEMNYDALVAKLKKKKSPKFIIIDSVQYWNITYDQYKKLKELFKRKTFIFISHASGKLPDGKTADKIRYDAGIKVRVEGFVAFVTSRYGGNTPYVIWPEGARHYWGKNFKKVIKGVEPEKEKAPKPKPIKDNENTSIHPVPVLAEPGESLLGDGQVHGESERLLPELVAFDEPKK